MTLLDCVCGMQNHPGICFFMRTWSQIRSVVTSNSTKDLLAFSCDALFLLLQWYHTLSQKLEEFSLVFIIPQELLPVSWYLAVCLNAPPGTLPSFASSRGLQTIGNVFIPHYIEALSMRELRFNIGKKTLSWIFCECFHCSRLYHIYYHWAIDDYGIKSLGHPRLWTCGRLKTFS